MALRQKCIERCKQNAKSQKGKSYEDLYGEEKSKNIKGKLSSASSGANNPMYGDSEHTAGLRKYNNFRKGKSWDENKLIYKIVTEDDIHILTTDEVAKLHSSGEVIFIERYERMYQERYNR